MSAERPEYRGVPGTSPPHRLDRLRTGDPPRLRVPPRAATPPAGSGHPGCRWDSAGVAPGTPRLRHRGDRPARERRRVPCAALTVRRDAAPELADKRVMRRRWRDAPPQFPGWYRTRARSGVLACSARINITLRRNRVTARAPAWRAPCGGGRASRTPRSTDSCARSTGVDAVDGTWSVDRVPKCSASARLASSRLANWCVLRNRPISVCARSEARRLNSGPTRARDVDGSSTSGRANRTSVARPSTNTVLAQLPRPFRPPSSLRLF